MKFENLEFPKTIKENILGQEVEIRPYLISGEIDNIVENMLAQDLPMQRIMIKELGILTYCTNIEVENSLYDLYKTNGIIDKVMSLIDEDYLIEIDDCYYEATCMNSIVKDFLVEANNKMGKFLDNMGNVDLNKMVKEFVKLTSVKEK